MVADSFRPGFYCPATERAVRALQEARHLRVDGICDRTTWLAVVEASWRLGDRLVVLTSPNMRGDDIAELQTILGRLGFDCGRVDGIFGPVSQGALIEFQRNCGLDADGICGADTVRTLELMARQSGSGPGVAMVREIALLSEAERSLADLRIVIGQFGGLSPLARQITHALRQRGARVTTTDELDPTSHAAVANRVEAAVYIGIESRADDRSTISYYSVPTFSSPGGAALAGRLAAGFASLGITAEVVGVRHPVLRETRMPAVLCSLGPVGVIVARSPQITRQLTEALADWARRPLDPPGE